MVIHPLLNGMRCILGQSLIVEIAAIAPVINCPVSSALCIPSMFGMQSAEGLNLPVAEDTYLAFSGIFRTMALKDVLAAYALMFLNILWCY